MAWTTPGTATAGEVLTAAFWNQNVRDNLNSVKSAVINLQDRKNLTTDVTLAVGGVSEVSSSLACTVAASTSDILIVGFNTFVQAGTNIAHYNLMTKVGATLTNRLVPAGNSFEPFYCGATFAGLVTGSGSYKVVAGDISGGNVTVTLVVNTAGASRKVVEGTVGASMYVVNIGKAIA
jgi:hypothetical protein